MQGDGSGAPASLGSGEYGRGLMREAGRGSDFPLRTVVIYAKQDVDLAIKLVRFLRASSFEVWWAEEDLTQGAWDDAVRKHIETCHALIPFVSQNTGVHKIFTDEWTHAERRGKPIFPFVLDESGIPFGKGRTSYTAVSGDQPSAFSEALETLKAKLFRHFSYSAANGALNANRLREVYLANNKVLPLPSFVFSLSSFETQVHPLDGLELLASLPESTCLVSAFDVHESPGGYTTKVKAITSSPQRSVLLDSGNYEAVRRKAHAGPKRKDGWSAKSFWQVATSADWDLVFSYDHPVPQGTVAQVSDKVLDAYFRDMLETGLDNRTLCPIVHAVGQELPAEDRRSETAKLVLEVARSINPTLVAIPERELGDGLIERMRTVKEIRKKLNSLSWYQPLHILGTGNPTTLAALAVCGADTFDGLEWCRTAANYEHNSLMHFQQFDLLKNAFTSRMAYEQARKMASLEGAPFAFRAASYNFDYFSNWSSLVRDSAHSAKPQTIFQGIPQVGAELAREYLNGTAAIR